MPTSGSHSLLMSGSQLIPSSGLDATRYGCHCVGMRQILLVVAVALAVAGCNDSNPTQPSTGTGTAVSMVNSGSGGFSPTTLTTTVGSTVVWTNRDSTAHTTTSNSGLWNSGNVQPNGTFSFQFTTAGTFPYRCTLHAGMTGTVIVQ